VRERAARGTQPASSWPPGADGHRSSMPMIAEPVAAADEGGAAKVILLILNWNRPSETIGCLESLAVAEGPVPATIVIDNGSSDDSVVRIGEAFPEIELLSTGQNLGYAGGNNQGIRRALDEGAAWVGILNNDVRVAKDFLGKMLEVMASDNSIGVVIPILVEADDPELIWTAGAGIDNGRGTVVRHMAGQPVSTLEDARPFEVEVAPGAAMLVRRDVFLNAGLFDEQYFLYFEEGDWSLRVRKAGYRIVVAPAARAAHKVSATLGQYSAITDYYYNRNQFRFILRNWQGSRRWGLLAYQFGRQALALMALFLHTANQGKRASRAARRRALVDAIRGQWGAGSERPE